jgi:hypothetical protein
MEAILKFNLPEDRDDFTLAINGSKMWSILWELDQHLRAEVKYAPDTANDDKLEAYTEIREKLREFMSDSNISFDMVS